MWLLTASNSSTVGNKIRLFPIAFHVFTSSRLTLAEAFQSENFAACSTAFALGRASVENASGGYVAVPCPCKVKQHKSTVDWLNF